ncbi:hypothetical protein [Marinicrinis lubricantis]|uniref:Uncharacterized protein n=1 Tax=Marinicrinis lubricantis TaxID=2086470 RepID=A0ABW1IVV2_9BACL
MKNAVALLLLIALITFPACSSFHNNSNEQGISLTNEQAVPNENADSGATDEQIVTERAMEAVQLLKEQNFNQLSSMVHPEKGVRLSPYAFVYLDQDITLSADQLVSESVSREMRVWGHYDGSGEPIEATFSGYYEQFIFDVDFSQPDETSFNRRIGQGTTANNAFEAYPEAHIVEFHIRGIEEEAEGMDWRSLRLAFEQLDGTWYLVGIIHDQWTI